MSHKMLRPFIVKVSVLGYFPLHAYVVFIFKNYIVFCRFHFIFVIIK